MNEAEFIKSRVDHYRRDNHVIDSMVLDDEDIDKIVDGIASSSRKMIYKMEGIFKSKEQQEE